MNKKYIVLASLALFAFNAPVFAAETSSETTKVSGTDAAGTSYSSDQKVKVKAHDNGTTDTTVKTEESKDPKGLFNKSKKKSKETTTTDKDGNVTKDKKSVNGKVVEETK